VSTCPRCLGAVAASHAFCPNCAEPLQADAPREAVAAKKARPRTGLVSAVAALNVVVGVLGVLGGLAGLGVGGAFFASGDKYAGAAGLVFGLLGAGGLFLLGPFLILGIGLWRRRPWARLLSLVAFLLWLPAAGFVGLAAVSESVERPTPEAGAVFAGCAVWAGLLLAQLVVLLKAKAEFRP
jgi:hypothetical protein